MIVDIVPLPTLQVRSIWHNFFALLIVKHIGLLMFSSFFLILVGTPPNQVPTVT